MTKLQSFLKTQDDIIAADRAQTLVALGLTEKEYAPDNLPSREYPQEEWVDGEKRYYREVAISVTDEEYAQILAKTAAVEAIRKKNATEQAKKRPAKTEKQWLPIFKLPEQRDENGRPIVLEETGKCKLAFLLRVLALAILAVGLISGLVLLSENVFSFLTTAIATVVEVLLLYAVAEILDYLATLSAVAKQGYHYRETTKK